MTDDFLAILGAIALIIATVLVLPFISFWLCYFGGWVASITIGNILTDGSKYFVPDNLVYQGYDSTLRRYARLDWQLFQD